jgi:hypothetical protein
MRAGAWAMPGVVVVVAVCVWYVQAPPRTVGDYRERTSMTVESLRSQVQTARLWVREVQAGRVTRRAAVVAFREAEGDAVSAVSRFAPWDPPGDTRDLRPDVARLAGEVTEALAELRLAAEDERWNALPGLATPLPGLAERLDRLARRIDP